MALTKVTGQVIKNTTDVTVGVLTVTNTLAVGGTVSIGGTLTYEDVTNVDAVGLITARNGIVVGSGITLSKDGDGFFTGVTTATTFVGALTGTASGNTTISNNADNRVITGGSGNALNGESTLTFDGTTLTTNGSGGINISQSGSDLTMNSAGSIFTGNGGNASDPIVANGSDTNTGFFYPAADTIAVTTGGSEALRINSSRQVGIDQTNPSSLLHIQDLSADGYELKLSGNSIQFNRTSLSYIDQVNDTGSLVFRMTSSNTEAFRITSDGAFGLAGANYGTSGQVLTSGGSSSSPSWTTISGTTINSNADNRVITGSGTANTLEAESNVVINGNNLIIGHTASTTTSNGESPFLQIKSTDSRGGASFIRHSANAAGGGLYIGKSRNATIGSNTVVQADDELGRITFSGDDGTDINTEAAKIQVHVDATPGSNDMPGRLMFFTTSDGAGSPTERMRIDKDGVVTKPYTPMFRASYGGAAITLNAGDITFGTVHNNVGNHYNSSNGRFTAPVTGVYYFYVGWYVVSHSNHRVALRINGSEFTQPYISGYNIGQSSGVVNQASSQFLPLTAGDYVNVWTDNAFTPYGHHLGWGGILLG